MSVRDAARLLRLKSLRADRAAAALARARAEAEAEARAARLARVSLETRLGIERRIRGRAYRGILDRPVGAAALDALDGTLIALHEDTARARDAAVAAEVRLASARETEEDARVAAVAANRAREVWVRLAGRARAAEDAAARAAEDARAEAMADARVAALGAAG